MATDVFLSLSFRALEDWDSSPPCMADIFRCMGKASRVALSAIARHLRLRSEYELRLDVQFVIFLNCVC